MILSDIRLLNFRQFLGEQSFHFTTGEKGDVSLIFGNNGSGKTTLLNAFTWTLYGRLSDDVEHPEELATHEVWAKAPFGELVEVRVEVTFSHGGSTFTARRTATVEKAGESQSPRIHGLELWETLQDGRSVEVHAPQQKIESILPQRLSRFFFFNGERIEKLVGLKAYSEVKQDIKTLLGLEIIERSLSDLPKVRKKLGADLKNHADETTTKLQEDIERREEQLESVTGQLTSLTDDRAVYNEERESVLEALRQHAGVAPLQARRDDVGRQVARLRASLVELNATRQQRVARQGFLAFTQGSVRDAMALADQLSEKGELPAPLKRDFVDSLLERKECICGTSLEEGEETTRRVQDWRKNAGLAAVEQAWQILRGQSAAVLDAASSLGDDLITLGEQIEVARAEIAESEALLSELDAQVSKLPLEDVRELEMKSNELARRISETDQELGNKRRLLDMGQTSLDKLRTQLERAEVLDKNAAKSRERIALVTEVLDALERLRQIRTDSMRSRLDAKVKRIFKSISMKDQFPQLSDDFELALYQTVGGKVQQAIKSTGENQILSLSFVAAVSELAREVAIERRAHGETPSEEDGAFPIVMDAAFGSLDEGYQRAVARLLAEMAPQMVILVSKSQGMGPVLEELDEHLGSLGVIQVFSGKQNLEPETIVLKGHEYGYVSPSGSGTWARLEEVAL